MQGTVIGKDTTENAPEFQKTDARKSLEGLQRIHYDQGAPDAKIDASLSPYRRDLRDIPNRMTAIPGSPPEYVALRISAVYLLDTFLLVVCRVILDTTYHENGRIVDHISRKFHSVVPTTTMVTVEHTEVVTHMVNEVIQHFFR
jgi:hypothetical protein